MRWVLKLLILGLLWITTSGWAAMQPIAVTINNNSSLDLQINPAKTQSTNLDSNDLKYLQQQTIIGNSSQTFTFRNTGEPVRLFLVLRTASSEPDRVAADVVQWEYIESPQGVIGCNNTQAFQSFVVNCASNDSLEQPRVVLTINDSQSYSVNNVGPLTVTIINNSNVDVSLAPGDSKNISPSDLQRIAGEEVYAHATYTIQLSRTAYPARLYLNFNTSQAEGSHSSHIVGQWEYGENEQTPLLCHRILPVYPYKMTCYGTADIAEPAVFITITAQGTQVFPIPN